MGSVTKQKSHAGRNVFVFFLVFTILVAGVVIGLSYVFKNKDVTPSVAGYSLYIMDSDKMLDKVPRGALVLASNDTPSAEKLGKAVLCENVPGVGTSVFWLADVSSKEGEDGVYYTVYQEKNPSLTYELRSSNVVGEATTYYTTAGKAITFMTSRFGMVICIGSPIALMIIIELILAIASSDGYEEYEEDDEDDFVVDDKKEKPASIDDILFSGDDSTPIARQQLGEREAKYVQSDEDYSDEETDADIIGAVVEVDEPEQPEEEKPIMIADEPEEEPEQAAEEVKPAEPEVHKVKLPPVEKAEPEPEVKTVKIPEQPKPQPKPQVKKSAPRPRRPKSMDTSIEDLMKLMEESQQKLKEEIEKK